jgi:four helix bundle protein
MALIVADLSIELIEKLRPLVPRIKARDKSLADQIQRAASSIALNIGEAEYSDPGNRRARFHTAAGRAGETRAAGRTAVGWGIIPRADGAPAAALLDPILPILWKLDVRVGVRACRGLAACRGMQRHNRDSVV